MNVNKHILIATGVIVAGGVIKKWNTPQATLTPVLIGGVVFMMVLSVADLFGGGMSQLASGLSMVAMVTVILTEFPWGTIFAATGVTASGIAAAGTAAGSKGTAA